MTPQFPTAAVVAAVAVAITAGYMDRNKTLYNRIHTEKKNMENAKNSILSMK